MDNQNANRISIEGSHISILPLSHSSMIDTIQSDSDLTSHNFNDQSSMQSSLSLNHLLSNDINQGMSSYFPLKAIDPKFILERDYDNNSTKELDRVFNQLDVVRKSQTFGLKSPHYQVVQLDLRHEYELRKNKGLKSYDKITNIMKSKEKANNESPKRITSSLNPNENVVSHIDQYAMNLGHLVLENVLKRPQINIPDSISRVFLDIWLRRCGSDLTHASAFDIELLQDLQKSIADVSTNIMLNEKLRDIPNVYHNAYISKLLLSCGLNSLDDFMKEYSHKNPVLQEIRRSILPAIFSEYPFSDSFDTNESLKIERIFHDDDDNNIIQESMKQSSHWNEYELECSKLSNSYDTSKHTRYISYKTWHESYCELKDILIQQNLKLSKYFSEYDNVINQLKHLSSSYDSLDLNNKELIQQHYQLNVTCDSLKSSNHELINTNTLLQLKVDEISNLLIIKDETINSQDILLEDLRKNNKSLQSEVSHLKTIITNHPPDLSNEYHQLQVQLEKQDFLIENMQHVISEHALVEEHRLHDVQVYYDTLILKHNDMLNKYSSYKALDVIDDDLIRLASQPISEFFQDFDIKDSHKNLLDFTNQWLRQLVLVVDRYRELIINLKSELHNVNDIFLIKESDLKYQIGQLTASFKLEKLEIESHYTSSINQLQDQLFHLQSYSSNMEHLYQELKGRYKDLEDNVTRQIQQGVQSYKEKFTSLNQVNSRLKEQLLMISEDKLIVSKLQLALEDNKLLNISIREMKGIISDNQSYLSRLKTCLKDLLNETNQSECDEDISSLCDKLSLQLVELNSKIHESNNQLMSSLKLYEETKQVYESLAMSQEEREDALHAFYSKRLQSLSNSLVESQKKLKVTKTEYRLILQENDNMHLNDRCSNALKDDIDAKRSIGELQHEYNLMLKKVKELEESNKSMIEYTNSLHLDYQTSPKEDSIGSNKASQLYLDSKVYMESDIPLTNFSPTSLSRGLVSTISNHSIVPSTNTNDDMNTRIANTSDSSTQTDDIPLLSNTFDVKATTSNDLYDVKDNASSIDLEVPVDHLDLSKGLHNSIFRQIIHQTEEKYQEEIETYADILHDAKQLVTSLHNKLSEFYSEQQQDDEEDVNDSIANVNQSNDFSDDKMKLLINEIPQEHHLKKTKMVTIIEDEPIQRFHRDDSINTNFNLKKKIFDFQDFISKEIKNTFEKPFKGSDIITIDNLDNIVVSKEIHKKIQHKIKVRESKTRRLSICENKPTRRLSFALNLNEQVNTNLTSKEDLFHANGSLNKAFVISNLSLEDQISVYQELIVNEKNKALESHVRYDLALQDLQSKLQEMSIEKQQLEDQLTHQQRRDVSLINSQLGSKELQLLSIAIQDTLKLIENVCDFPDDMTRLQNLMLSSDVMVSLDAKDDSLEVSDDFHTDVSINSQSLNVSFPLNNDLISSPQDHMELDSINPQKTFILPMVKSYDSDVISNQVNVNFPCISLEGARLPQRTGNKSFFNNEVHPGWLKAQHDARHRKALLHKYSISQKKVNLEVISSSNSNSNSNSNLDKILEDTLDTNTTNTNTGNSMDLRDHNMLTSWQHIQEISDEIDDIAIEDKKNNVTTKYIQELLSSLNESSNNIISRLFLGDEIAMISNTSKKLIIELFSLSSRNQLVMNQSLEQIDEMKTRLIPVDYNSNDLDNCSTYLKRKLHQYLTSSRQIQVMLQYLDIHNNEQQTSKSKSTLPPIKQEIARYLEAKQESSSKKLKSHDMSMISSMKRMNLMDTRELPNQDNFINDYDIDNEAFKLSFKDNPLILKSIIEKSKKNYDNQFKSRLPTSNMIKLKK